MIEADSYQNGKLLHLPFRVRVGSGCPALEPCLTVLPGSVIMPRTRGGF